MMIAPLMNMIWRSVAGMGLALLATGAGVAHADAGAPVQAIAARYETVDADASGRVRQKSNWYMMRTENRIETAGEGRAEIWDRSERGDVSMRRLFRDEHLILEYHPGDLRAMSMESEWRVLGSVLDPKVLARFARLSSKKAPGGPVDVYRGGAGHDRVDVWWNAALSLPALVRRTGDAGSYTMKLVELRDAPPADWPVASRWQTDEFRVVDAADLGDLEHDPLVQRVLRADAPHRPGGAHEHGHD